MKQDHKLTDVILFVLDAHSTTHDGCHAKREEEAQNLAVLHIA
jgi:hypothetical protein